MVSFYIFDSFIRKTRMFGERVSHVINVKPLWQKSPARVSWRYRCPYGKLIASQNHRGEKIANENAAKLIKTQFIAHSLPWPLLRTRRNHYCTHAHTHSHTHTHKRSPEHCGPHSPRDVPRDHLTIGPRRFGSCSGRRGRDAYFPTWLERVFPGKAIKH